MEWNDLKNEYSSNIKIAEETDPYVLLGVQPGCGVVDLKSAYIKCVKLYHPDNKDVFMREYSERMLKVMIRAYEKIKGDINE